MNIILIWNPFITIISNKAKLFIFGLAMLFKAFLIASLLCLIIGKLEELALIHLLNKALIKDFSSSESLLFIKYITL